LAYVDGDVEVCGGLKAVLPRSFADVLDEWMLDGGRVLPRGGREGDAETHVDVNTRHQRLVVE